MYLRTTLQRGHYLQRRKRCKICNNTINGNEDNTDKCYVRHRQDLDIRGHVALDCLKNYMSSYRTTKDSDAGPAARMRAASSDVMGGSATRSAAHVFYWPERSV